MHVDSQIETINVGLVVLHNVALEGHGVKFKDHVLGLSQPQMVVPGGIET